jgi:uncharacterized protein (DUF2236 family)
MLPSTAIGDRDPIVTAADLQMVGPRSVAWKINGERITLLGWGRAILLQFAHPLVAAGVAEHSHFAGEPLGRLRRFEHTLNAMLALTFGTPESALATGRHIDGIHGRVHGILRDPAGPFAAGTPYYARDPHLLRWVHATLVDSLLRVYPLYVGPLSAADRDRYCREATGMAPLLHIPDGYLPNTAADLARYMDEMLGSGEIVVGDTARGLARELLRPLGPPILRPLEALLQLPMIGLLPPAVREGYGFRWTPRHQAALRRSAALSRRVLPLLPAILRRWPAERAAARRHR